MDGFGMMERKRYIKKENNNRSFVLKKFTQFFGVALVAALAVGLMVFLAYIDISAAGRIKDASYTENLQETLLVFSSAIFIYLAKKKSARGLLLMAGFFACMFIREWDAVFDDIFHGAWKYIAIPTAIGFMLWALREGLQKVWDDLAEFMRSKSYDIIVAGLIIVLVVSRLLGNRAVWMLMSGPDFKYVFKTFIEEGVELLGYMTVFVGSLHYYINNRK